MPEETEKNKFLIINLMFIGAKGITALEILSDTKFIEDTAICETAEDQRVLMPEYRGKLFVWEGEINDEEWYYDGAFRFATIADVTEFGLIATEPRTIQYDMATESMGVNNGN